uniref:Reverse transcriptase domain-containing protein n=1 Tax=Tanacetum cinerariifolium TaxID=118510 RepID=A0A6L2NAB6_TANCI|nr:reverse transcriptase domain-containing protein [Tanacetum cinerariifolium]
MADNRTMEEMLQEPIEGYGDAIVVPDILAENFEIKTGLLSLIQANQFHGFESNNPHDHIRSFNRSTLNLKFRDMPNDAIKLMLFPYSFEGAAKICSSSMDARIDKLTDTISNLVETFKKKMTTPATVKAVEETCVIGGGSGSLPSNIVPNPQEDLKAITTRSGVTLARPSVSPPPPPSKAVIREPKTITDQNLHFELSFTDALLHMPKFALMFKSLLNNKEKLFDLATTLVNKNCSAVILKKLLEKLRDPGKFLIPCDFLELDECLALADLGASINLIPLSIWRKLSLPKLTSTQMIFKLADRSTTRPAGIAEDVFVKVGKFHFPTNFVVVDYVVDPCIPLILERPFLRTGRSLIDVYGEELTLHVDDEEITFKVGQTSKYSYNYAKSINQIDVIDVACEEYVQKVLGFFDNSKSGTPIPTSDPIVSSSSPSFTPFERNDDYYDSEGDIFYLEKLLNEDPSPNLPPVKTEDLKQVDATMTKPSIEEPLELDLKELPSHLKYSFLEGTNKLPVIISKELKDEEKSALLKVLKSHKQAIAWKISVIKGAENLAADHLSRLENPHQEELEKKEITQTFPLETLEAKALPTNDARVVVKFLKSLFARFGTPRAIISYRGTHFYKDQFVKFKLKYGVTHRLSTVYHPQTSRQVEVSNHGLKRILERTIGENQAFWFDKLDDALWAFRTTFKTPIGCTPYKLVYEKPCHLPIKLKHKAYWALKHCNFDLKTANDHGKVQLNVLNELRDQAYENYLIYKEKTKKIHDSKIKDRVFKVGDRVLLFSSRLKILSGKLKTRWTRPFTVAQVLPYGTIELSQADGPNFKVNGHRLKHYFGGDIPQLVVPDLQTFPMDQ